MFRAMRWLALTLVPAVLAAQTPPPPDIARERAALTAWLTSDPRSPYAALALQPIGRSLTLGPAPSDIELAGIGRATVSEDGGVVRLAGAAPGTTGRVLPRGRAVPLGPYRMAIEGAVGRSVAVVYGDPRGASAPAFYPYDAALVTVGTLSPATRAGTQRLLAPDGIEVEATAAGTFVGRVGPARIQLVVYRIPGDGDESELLIYFRDQTSDRGSYPAGRFVELEPAADGRYRLDFNRARNPLCAYSSVFPCPVPWPGNSLAIAVTAGERYAPHP
jgi:hypothetical protein